MAINPTSSHSRDTFIIWRIVDGKAGHEAQTAGLVSALKLQIPVQSYDIEAGAGLRPFISALIGSYPLADELPNPDLIIGAGHQTHMTILAAKRSYGGKAAVLMRPTIPTVFFDFCLIPEHDSPPSHANVITTRGVLNAVTRSLTASETRGLILVGGPSKHHGWDSDAFIQKLSAILQSDQEVDWTLTTSRRTPDDCTKKLLSLSYPNLEVVPVEQTPAGWVAQRLQECGKVWVSSDSISMIYESLTAGAAVGLFRVPIRNPNARVVRAVQGLVDDGLVVLDDAVERLTQPHESESVGVFNEAARCADLLLSKLAIESSIAYQHD